MRRLRSLQARLLALVLGVVAAVWAATAAVTWFDVRHELDELLDSHLAQAAAVLVVQHLSEVEPDDDGHAIDAPLLERYAPRTAFQVFHEGRLVVRSANAPVRPMVSLAGGDVTGLRSVAIDGVDWRVFVAQGADRDVRVFVGERIDSRASILRAVLRGTLGPMLVALPVLAVTAWWAVHLGVAPLRRLGRVLARRPADRPDPVAVDDAPSEMVPMIAALNGLLQRIGGLLDAERRFTADAAHEMRTPIAAIRAQAQVALGESDDAARRRALEATLAGCDRASRLVDQLLTLSRLEAGSPMATVDVDVSAVARQVVAGLAPEALRKEQAIELRAAEACPVAGDATLLGVMVRNLVDNAVRYSPAGARVRVTVARDAQRGTVLDVEDSGPGMADADRARLGERFFRVVGSGEAGSGLGGSIARRIAAAHGASVCVGRSTDLGGLAVRIGWAPVREGARRAAAAGDR